MSEWVKIESSEPPIFSEDMPSTSITCEVLTVNGEILNGWFDYRFGDFLVNNTYGLPYAAIVAWRKPHL